MGQIGQNGQKWEAGGGTLILSIVSIVSSAG